MRSLALILGTTVLVVACSGGGGSGEGGGGGSSSNTFATEYCDLTGGVCCPKQGKTYSGETCRALVSLASVQEGVTFDANVASQCLTAIRGAQSQPTFCNDLGGDAVDKGCDGVYKRNTTGTVQPGATCERDTDCAPDPSGEVECAFIFTGGESKRSCQLQVHAKEGDECLGDKPLTGTTNLSSGDVARAGVCWEADGLYCSGSTGSSTSGAKRTCTKQSPVGGDCKYNDRLSCVKGARCDTKTSKCALLGAVGADCATTQCVEDAYCDTGTKKCAAVIPTGGACTTNTQCGNLGSCTNGKCEGGGNLGVALFYCAQ